MWIEIARSVSVQRLRNKYGLMQGIGSMSQSDLDQCWFGLLRPAYFMKTRNFQQTQQTP